MKSCIKIKLMFTFTVIGSASIILAMEPTAQTAKENVSKAFEMEKKYIRSIIGTKVRAFITNATNNQSAENIKSAALNLVSTIEDASPSVAAAIKKLIELDVDANKAFDANKFNHDIADLLAQFEAFNVNDKNN